MKIFIQILLLLAFSLNSWGQKSSVRNRVSIDLNWKFLQQECKGAEQPNFNDQEWRTLNVPHDWSIEGEYKQDNPSGTMGAFLPGGIGWYRKQIDINNLKKSEKYFIEFDGVYLNSDVWINGHHLGFHPNGYMSFSYDLSPYLKEGDNILAVRVDHSKTPSGRWYTGSGIYRHVWLTKTENIYVPKSGTYIISDNFLEDQATVKVQTTVVNESGKNRKALVRNSIRDYKGNLVKEVSDKLLLKKDTSVIVQDCIVKAPQLWSTDAPVMYTMVTEVIVNKKVVDRYETPFGIRNIEWRSKQGLFVNGEAVIIKGLSNHQDAGGAVGVAVPDDVLYRRLKMLKEMGCNALRTAHHPFAPEFYTMCDTMGFMVMDEAFDGWWTAKAPYDYGNYFDEYWEKDLESFLKRDRNHPSVIIWSIGNEVRKFTPEQQKIVVDKVKSIDTTRPVTQGRGYIAPYIDISGFNGHGELKNELEKYHSKYPEKLIIGTEITHTLQTRGVYRTKTWYRTKDNPAPWEKPAHFARIEKKVTKIPDLTEEEVFTGVSNKYQSSYDNSIVRIGVRDEWKRVEALDYYVGNFRWTGFDYLGESFGWPGRTANFGIIDLAGFPKDHFYLYQSLWSDKPMVHVLPHWSHKGKEGVEIPVVLYTNCQTAELFLNNTSLGEKTMTSERQLVWKVPYEKGTIKAVAKIDGVVVAEQSYTTVDRGTKLTVSSDKTLIYANNKDIIHCEISITDEYNNIDPNAMNTFEYEVLGPGRIIGLENGNILDISSNNTSFKNVFNGKCLLIIQATEKTGEITIKVKSTDLQPAILTVRAIDYIK
ncbi:sugar-binding domain-containing protein [Flammeovirga kamogawensis]|uniref:DUF4982 domain-containing protein n=1 Tax=Flammeovirga kamogawensis TaxID=373891 RepID=A0ABX8H0A9_9BACT|nr:sugar-binding domain-containing protein [Flammeovirga kamogawensis]MBB6462282.1 beta-galactosidase [Flammeovirga kamogawensis]QWG09325.1 DUF4982 domain-containing protein [Flammeovirga kamogawensis]TRX64847.1 DUF4982 domain-containing protein [Flammeovirga kamogawensis]